MSVAATLAACGGGGDAGPGATNIATNSATADTGTTLSTTSGTRIVVGDASTGYTCNLPNFQAELLQRINALRAATVDCGTDTSGHVYGVFQPAAALTWSAVLTNAAAGHSADMAAKNYFSHTSLDGTAFSARITAAGYNWSTVAENIAAGQTTVQKVMDAWAASPGHCANLMNPNLREVGVACVPGTSTSTYGLYWTMDLGTPR